MKHCDVAVIGLGVMGAAAVWECARSGARVIGFETGGPTHADGSSHGATRIYRQAYWEGESYLPLLRLADVGWRQLQSTCEKPLLVQTGGIFIGPKAMGVVDGSRRTALAGNIEHEHWDFTTIRQRLDQFAITDDMCAVYEPGAYRLASEDARLHMLDEAVRASAELSYGDAVSAIEPNGERLVVHTQSGLAVEAGSVIVCTGPWMRELVPEIIGACDRNVCRSTGSDRRTGMPRPSRSENYQYSYINARMARCSMASLRETTLIPV